VGKALRQFGLANTRGPLTEQRLAELHGQKECRRDLVAGDVLLATQRFLDLKWGNKQ
jgi:hypothetical protein